jgi:hypothetical protein
VGWKVRYQYLHLSRSTASGEVYGEAELEQLCSDGWEPYAVTQSGDALRYHLRRLAEAKT